MTIQRTAILHNFSISFGIYEIDFFLQSDYLRFYYNNPRKAEGNIVNREDVLVLKC